MRSSRTLCLFHRVQAELVRLSPPMVVQRPRRCRDSNPARRIKMKIPPTKVQQQLKADPRWPLVRRYIFDAADAERKTNHFENCSICREFPLVCGVIALLYRGAQ